MVWAGRLTSVSIVTSVSSALLTVAISWFLGHFETGLDLKGHLKDQHGEHQSSKRGTGGKAENLAKLQVGKSVARLGPMEGGKTNDGPDDWVWPPKKAVVMVEAVPQLRLCRENCSTTNALYTASITPSLGRHGALGSEEIQSPIFLFFFSNDVLW
ncbi:hypothetical protein, variant [Exophiala mesophila]|uniref:Uncharacterized protein n=1 Tax=Exophiala mesophila TaxID=212818 RepID=A0A0D1ZKC9_EXOME|nr:uncharacterized protein PV10_02744 [Exophiala mesophila]XP_016226612.1 hypothetical protein, variant [Exophiala mesophila]KIV95037.1 hypothetical protein PV10_02744 [Exophiala mesophila]KIV95038.1 hypothetical protein, variant [Exophiala mesophila]